MMNARSTTMLQAGFTLIETLMAMAIFTVGILGLFGMQSAAIKENLSANGITTGAYWASDRVEQLIAMSYADLNDKDGDGCGGTNDATSATADGCSARDAAGNEGCGMASPIYPVYSVYWNIASDCTMTDIPDAGKPEEERKPKLLRIIVTVNKGSSEEVAASFNYIKQNTNQNK